MAALVAFAAGALLALAAGPVLAVVEPDLHAYEVRLPLEQRSPVLSIPATDREAALLLPGLDAFRAAEGAGWRLLQWDPRLRAPACMAGPGIPLKAAGHSREALVAACEAFIRGKSGLLHARPEELRLLDSVDLGEGRTYIIFGQFVGGLEVVGGRLDIALRNGAVVLVGSNLYPDVAIDPVPAIDGGLAWRFAHDGIPWEATDQPLGESRLVILPLHRAGSIGHHLAWEVRLETGAPECVWRAYVDASDGEVLWRESERSYAQIRGSSTQDVEEKTVGDPYVRHPMRDGTIVAGGSHTGHTGVEGSFTIEVPDGGPIEVVAELRGRWCDIENRNGPDARIALTGVAGESFDFSFEDANSHAAERDAYHHMNVAHDWIKRIDPTFTGMDQIVPANVNVQNTCNAYWDGAALHFYREGGGCNNAGRISDVIYHEYGHGITQRIYAPLAPPAASGMGEAFSDIDAMSINGDPEVGEGFYAGGGFLRTGENLRQYPGTECAGQVHCLGEILMGAMWKARANLSLKHGQRAASLFDS
ncbi:MAG: hypothetical protein FJY88_14165, partial [Candidatus Eisenbacteria bacterium]|nr:hypothetical protein [Candidatus Eisenbacteria bacterium]